MLFQCRRNFDRIDWVYWRCMCHRHDRDHVPPFRNLACGYDGAGTVFAAFLCPFSVLPPPQI